MSERDTPLQRAIDLAVYAHAGQVDKSDYPYICHAMAVMRYQRTELAQVAAVLHDVLEDTFVTFEWIRQLFPVWFVSWGPELIEVLDALTKRDDESYEDYIRRVCQNEIACLVKLADLEDNMDPRRRLGDREDLLKKYEWARAQVLEALHLIIPMKR